MGRIVGAWAAAVLVVWGVSGCVRVQAQMAEPWGQPQLRAPEVRSGFMPHEGPLITIMLSRSRELELTPDQIQKLQALRTGFQKEAVRRNADIRVAEIDLNALLEKEPWDLAAIESQVKQIAGLRGDLRFARIKTLAAGLALLTPEQLRKLKAMGHRAPPMGGPGRMGPWPSYGPVWPGAGPGYSPAPRQ